MKPQVSFNPCFLGSCSPSLTNLLIYQPHACFNPCFLGSCSPRAQAGPSPGQIRCFNPCFLGSCSPRPRTRLIHQAGSFQSLFSWILLSEDAKPFLELNMLDSFNPCFLGSCSPSVNISLALMIPGAVSILVFLDLALRGSCGRSAQSEAKSQFQSLFSWILLSELILMLLILSAICFNPCFLGSCSPRSILRAM